MVQVPSQGLLSYRAVVQARAKGTAADHIPYYPRSGCYMRDAVPGMGAGWALPSQPGFFVCLRRDSRVVASRKASARAVSPSTWPVSTGVPESWVKASATWPAGLALRSVAGGVLSGAGLGAGAGVISGKSPDAFPGADECGAVTFRSGWAPAGRLGDGRDHAAVLTVRAKRYRIWAGPALRWPADCKRCCGLVSRRR